MELPTKILVCCSGSVRSTMAVKLCERMFPERTGVTPKLLSAEVPRRKKLMRGAAANVVDVITTVVTSELVAWADVIWTLTARHLQLLRDHFPESAVKAARLNPNFDIEAPASEDIGLYRRCHESIEETLKFRINLMLLEPQALKLRTLPESELEGRVSRARTLMETHNIDALLLTTEVNFFYFSGLSSQFWQSPTRPNFLVLTRDNSKFDKPVAVVPSIMEDCLLTHTWIRDIRTWAAPSLVDDGVTLLCNTLLEFVPRGGKVGFMMGHESHVRTPLKDVLEIIKRLGAGGVDVVDGSPLVRELRMVKSAYEIACVGQACSIASAAFDTLPGRLSRLRYSGVQVTERIARREMQLAMVEYGADNMPYVMCQSGPGGYANIVMEPSDRVLQPGDVLIIDTGARFENYWCDFDRNFVVGGPLDPESPTARTHETLWLATEAGYNAAVEGKTSSDIFTAMMDVIAASGDFDEAEFSTGRMGHGLGLNLTELFSNKPGDDTPLKPGMVVTLEPGMPLLPSKDGSTRKDQKGFMIVHEEDIVISPDGKPAQWLSRRAPRTIPVILPALTTSPFFSHSSPKAVESHMYNHTIPPVLTL